MSGDSLLPSRRQFLSVAASAPLLGTGGTSAAHPAPLLAVPRLGAEFFLNSTETRDSIFLHFERMAATGLTLARIFTLWDQVEREQGRWNFTGYDQIYDAAAKNGIFVANTLCSEDPPGWMRLAPFYHAWHDLSDPALRPYSEIYLEQVVNRYKRHPAHGVWLLQNEPGIKSSDEPWVLAAYARWLERKYGTVERLNRVWYWRLRQFSDARAPEAPRTASWADYASTLDWRRFRCDYLADQLRWLHAQVDRHHPGALTHVNPPGLTSNMPADGRDMWRLKPTVHFLGASMHASWHFGMFPREDFGVAYGFCCDLVRSVSGLAPWWVTELQAGPTVFTGSRPLNPTPGEITRWLWDGFGNGARGIVYWLWHPRTEGNEAGEWALAGPGGEATERTLATRAVARTLDQHRDFFAAAQPVPARVAILYPRDAMILYAVDGWRRPSDEITHSLMGCYKALHRAHVAVDFVNADGLDAGALSRYRVLYLPYAYALAPATVAAIREFVRSGGTVWADGLVAWKDEQGGTKQFPPGPLSDVFGFTVEDIQAAWSPFSLTGQDQAGGELWRCKIPANATKPLLTAPDGRPAALEHTFGRGKALYYSTALTLGYLRREDPVVGGWIAGPAVEASHDAPIRVVECPAQVAFRAMEGPGRWAVVLNNWGGAAQVQLRCPAGTGAVAEIISATNVPMTGTGDITIELKEGGTAVLLATWPRTAR